MFGVHGLVSRVLNENYSRETIALRNRATIASRNEKNKGIRDSYVEPNNYGEPSER